VKRTMIAFGFLVALGLALAAANLATAGTSAQKGTKVTVAMHDPGCHWFQVGSSYRKTLAVKGPASLSNIDEAALIVRGQTATRRDPVGKTILLAKGVYHITMVGQAPDDNHLLLTVR